jgi:hypothetical protein
MGVSGSEPGKRSHDSIAKCNISDLYCLEDMFKFTRELDVARENLWISSGLRVISIWQRGVMVVP